MRDAILLDGVAKQIVSGVCAIMSDKNKPIEPIDLKKLYPEFFKSKKNPYTSEIAVWDAFLRG